MTISSAIIALRDALEKEGVDLSTVRVHLPQKAFDRLGYDISQLSRYGGAGSDKVFGLREIKVREISIYPDWIT